MTEWEKVVSLIPLTQNEGVKWEEFEKTALKKHIEKMKKTPQNPIWHGEGDVWTHTKMVVESLLSDREYHALPLRKREILFASALMHDIGKPLCTVKENGVWRSPRHTIVGSNVARELLWRDFGMAGSEELRALRECVCALIRCHSMPMHLSEQPDPERRLIRIAAHGELITDFTLQMLKILVKADQSGRISDEDNSEDASYTFMLAEELGIMQTPYPFPDGITRHAYLNGKNVSRDYPLYDGTWKEVILVAGLPGTGKDRWIKENYPSLPVISLDGIRAELGISPDDREGQSKVVAVARDRARELLRKKQSFVWNATNVTSQLRKKQLDLFEDYNAYTRIVFLETAFDTELKRNGERKNAVPERVIEKLLSKTEMPAVSEAHSVLWLTV